MDTAKFDKSTFKGRIKEAVKWAESLRSNAEQPTDISWPEIVKAKFNVSLESFYEDLGINPSRDTLAMIYNLPHDDARWVIPEIIREALLTGFRAAPIWPNIVAAEQETRGLEQVMPHINMSDATPEKIGIGETIPVGTISYGQKKVTCYKLGKGIKIPYEVLQYVSLDVISIFLRDFGIKLGHGNDVLAINTLINGEQNDGSASAPVLGVTTPNTLTYADILRIWVHMGRLGKKYDTFIGGEDAAVTTLNLAEFKTKYYGTTEKTLNVKTPVPENANFFVHGNVGSKLLLMLDKTSALLKFTAQPMNVESEKIVSNQTMAFYATTTQGFAKIFRDAAIVLDYSKNIIGYGWPTYLDVDALQNVVIE